MPAPGTLLGSSTAALRATVPLQGSRRLQELTATTQKVIGTLNSQISAADLASRSLSPALSHEDRTKLLVQPAFLRGQIASAGLLQKQFSEAAAHPPTAEYLMTQTGEKDRAEKVAAFDREARAIALKTLSDERAALLAKGGTEFQEDANIILQEIQSLQSGSNRAAAALINTVTGVQADEIRAVDSVKP